MDSAQILQATQLVLRWVHIFLGILWIGQTHLFGWLDMEFHAPPAEGEDVSKRQVWMVHSGGFYVVEKKRIPGVAPERIHWFKFEALFTWLTGMLLFFLVYHHGGVLVEGGAGALAERWGDQGDWVLMGATLAVVTVAWFVYDGLWMSPLGKNELAATAASFGLVVAAAWWLCGFFGGRGGYMHLGAIFGTLMVANVWVRILPAQRENIARVVAGREPDDEAAERAKNRSKMNSYMVWPVVFIMISNHYPATYGSADNWLVLSGLVLVGWGFSKALKVLIG